MVESEHQSDSPRSINYGTTEPAAEHDASPPSPLRRFLDWISPELQNSGSTARDHLASERTNLAWLRSSLSLASIGIAVTQLFRLTAVFSGPLSSTLSLQSSSSSTAFSLPSGIPTEQAIVLLVGEINRQQSRYAQLLNALETDRSAFTHLGKPIGGTFIAVGIVLLILGSGRYFIVQNALQRGVFPPARKSVLISSFFVFSIIVASFGVILAFR